MLDINEREAAFAMWLGLGVVVVALRADLRRSAREVLVAAWSRAIVISLGGYAVYLGLCIWAAAKVGAWGNELSIPTVWWFLGPAMVLYFGTYRLHQSGQIRKVLLPVLGVGALVNYIAGLNPFPFLVEFFVLQPALVLLVMVSAIAIRDDKTAVLGRIAGSILVVAGAIILLNSLVWLAVNWDEIHKRSEVIEFLLPVWMTAAAIPFLMVLNMWMSYESAFSRIDDRATGRRARWRAKTAVVLRFNVRMRALGDLAGVGAVAAAQADSFAAAWRALGTVIDERQGRLDREAEQLSRLTRFAGVQGTDELGQRLDRREFRETREALRTLSFAQMGWYRSLNARYRDDLPETLESNFIRKGLRKPSGVQQLVAEDGRWWFGWRRTISGWCLGIGASGPPPDQWFYEGPDPPVGPPGSGSGWGDSAHAATPDW